MKKLIWEILIFNFEIQQSEYLSLILNCINRDRALLLLCLRRVC